MPRATDFDRAGPTCRRRGFKPETLATVAGERILRRQAFDVIAASSGEEPLELVQGLDRSIDSLFTDVMMPGMNGRQLAEHLRQRDAGLPILFASGYAEDHLRTHTGDLREGTHFIPKPYDLDSLTLERLLAEQAELDRDHRLAASRATSS
ncbi:MAG: response regulator [Myxococcota bacterium]